MKTSYLWLNIFTVLVPLIFSFHPKLAFYKSFKYFLPSNLAVAILFILWDILFTKLGVWGFNDNYVIGLSAFGLPLEEILFFLCIPFACVFTYHCLTIFFKITLVSIYENALILFTSASLLVIGTYFYPKLYTASTFISLALLLIVLKYILQVKWLGKLLVIYPLLLVPFFLVNGFLTGSFTEEPVVWYNDMENVGIRIFTIPVEDIFYGFELIMLNVFFYEFFKDRIKTTLNA